MLLEPDIKAKIMEIKKGIYEKKQTLKSSKPEMPSQYPTKTSKDIVANLVNSLGSMDVSDGDNTDDDVLQSSAFMVKQRLSIDPPSDILEVKAHFEYVMNPNIQNSVYAISDGGADSCILGKHAKDMSYTGRFANLVGYDPENTKRDQVPIVSALIKTRSSSTGHYPVLLKVHEAPYLHQSPLTLLSEYQIREYGLICDSVAKKHRSSSTTYGTQRL